MKHLCAVFMAGMLVLLCVLLVTESKGVEENYEACIRQAKEQEEKGLYLNAISSYKDALEIYDEDPEIKYQILCDYKQMGDMENWNFAADLFIQNFPEDTEDGTLVRLYGEMADFYYENKDYEELVPLLNELRKKRFLSDASQLQEKVNAYYQEIRSIYTVINCDSPYLSDFYQGFAVKTMEGVMGQFLVMENGEAYHAEPFEEIFLLDKEKGYSLVKEQGQYKVYTAAGYLKDADAQGLSEARYYSQAYLAGKKDGKFRMYTSDFQDAGFGEWDDFHLIAPGAACIRTGDVCQLLLGNSVLQTEGESWSDIKYNERGVKENGTHFFVGREGNYSLISVDAEKMSYEILMEGLEDAQAFSTKEPAAIKQNGTWGFVSVDGEIVIEPQYESAKSFSYGYAPVKIDGMWTLVDTEGTQIMEPQFLDMGAPTEAGIVPVQTASRRWDLISLFIKNFD